MRELIQEVKYKRKRETQFGILYDFEISYDNKIGYYSSKSKDQKKFIPGQEAEFTEQEIEYTDKKTGEPKTFLKIKPVNPNKQSNFGKALKKEQTRYSGFAVSYAKDLVCAGRLPFSELLEYSTVLFDHMVELDKSIES